MKSPVAKNMNESNRAVTMRDRKNDYSRKGKSKWKHNGKG